MKNLILSLLILMVAAGCAEKAENLEEDQVTEYFSEIYVMPDSKLYVDEWGEPAEGEYVTEVSETSVEIRIEFEEGRINEGEYTNDDGTKAMVYEQRDGFLVQNGYHENGRKAVEFVMDDNMDIVAINSWFIDGTPSIVSNQDSSLIWHENGQLNSKIYLENGKMEGEGRSWHESGELAAISYFKDDEWHGTFKKWDENGNLIEEKTYDMGIPEGVHKFWDAEGNLVEERAYKGGKPISMIADN
ncbi:MAG: toxin-antitoxin system YwqK family antitoxin [Balneolaceae bacterium]